MRVFAFPLCPANRLCVFVLLLFRKFVGLFARSNV